MANSFNFGAPASSGAASGGLFGTAGNTFGSNQNSPNTTTGGGLFGNVGASSSGTSTPSLFGSAPAAGGSGNTLFGGGTGAASSGTATGSTPAFSFGTQSKPGSTPQSPSLFGGGSQTPKLGETPASGKTGGNTLFGSGAKPAGNIFGGAAATPAPSGGSLFGNTSTTPAGPPPQGGAVGQGQSLFGQAAQKPGGLFGGQNAATTSSSTASPTVTTAPATSGTPTLFGGAQQSQSTGGGLFGSNAQQKPLFGTTPSAPSGGGLFGNAAKDKPAESTTPTTTADGAAKPLFGAAPAAPAGQAQGSSLFNMPSAGTDQGTKPAFPSLGAATTTTTSQPSTALTASSDTPQKSIFPSLGGTTSATPSATPAAAPAGGGLFAGLGASKPAETGAATTTTAPASQPAAATGGLFGKPAETTPSTQAPGTATGATATTGGAKPSLTATSGPATSTSTTTTGTAAGTTTAAGGTALGASTVGPTPPAQSRLKNKTMDEIITRWATDLTKYQKEFREQAEKVAEWDRMLVENTAKVQKLYGSTVDADRATQEIERQLASVEGQQEELSSWLDRYEREVDEMMSKQVGPGEALQGPDQERERTYVVSLLEYTIHMAAANPGNSYKLAERLSEQLDEMGKDLTSMIEEVNGASATLSKTNKADEPVCTFMIVLRRYHFSWSRLC